MALLLAACKRDPPVAVTETPDAAVAQDSEPEDPAPVPRFAQEVVLDNRKRLFAPTWFYRANSIVNEYQDLEASFARGEVVDVHDHFYTPFRYRDPAALPTFRHVIHQPANRLQYLWAISVLGELGQRADFSLLKPLAEDGNPLVREYAVNALGKLARQQDLEFFKARASREDNDYVLSTLRAAQRRIEQPRPTPVTEPGYERTGLKKLAFFYNGTVAGGGHVDRHSFSARPSTKSAQFVFPHQQYRWGLEGTPGLPNFGGPMHHVGEDSGWFLQGLPVHAIADGVVCRVLYDLSWGTVVAIEHQLETGAFVTSYYAHLNHDVDVSPGQAVSLGEKLGEVGPAVSLENGGYWPHLHLGLEPVPCGEANIAGYDADVGSYSDPLWFIGGRLPSSEKPR
jgi:hypothetical protein